jgi:hypothetical protein
MTDPLSQRLDLLILARLATAGARPPSPRKLEDALFPFVEARLSRSEWSSRCTERLEDLRAAGEIDERRAVTKSGLDRLREALGVRTLPSKWGQIWQALLPALALDLPGSSWSEISSASKLRARLIRQHRELDLPPTPTLGQAVDAQAWQAIGTDTKGKLGAQKLKLVLMQRALGIPVRSIAEAVNAFCWTLLGEEPRTDFSMGRVRRVLLERTLDTKLRAPSLDATKVGEWLATDAAGTPKREIDVIRRSLVSRWLFAPRTTPPEIYEEGTTASVAREPAPDEQLPLERWARRVQALADATARGRYGDERVFIASVWREALDKSIALHETLEAFKARLVEANRAGLLRLHRADLVGAMDAALVDESETRHLNATFHFIETTP